GRLRGPLFLRIFPDSGFQMAQTPKAKSLQGDVKELLLSSRVLGHSPIWNFLY
ncbi:hypothetical protein STEG23_019609, partial [Scotinomys teguina]